MIRGASALEPGRDAPVSEPPRRRPERILILKPCCLGDVLMATPLAAALAAAWPGAAIDWAVDAHSRPALAGNPHLRGLLDASGTIRGDLRPGALLALLARIRRGRYDLACVPDRAPILALLPRLAGIPLRVGLDSGGRGRWHSLRVAVPPLRHEAELYLDLARALGLDPPPARLVFVPSPEDRAAAERALAEAGAGAKTTSGPLVALHPGGGLNPGMALVAKRWPVERFAALAEHLVAEWDARLLLLGGPGEAELAASLGAAMGAKARARSLDLSGRLGLGALGALIAHCALYVGNDSGIAHLASAVGTPVVVVFGPTRPERYGPLPGRGLAVAPTTPDDGASDGLRAAQGSKAIEAVPVDAVAAACGRCLAAAGRA